MSPLEIGYAGVLALVLLIFLRVPVAIALILPSIVGVWAIIGSRASWGSRAGWWSGPGSGSKDALADT